MTHTPHPFQQSARTQINRLLNAARHPVLCSPTGTGKTFTAGLITGDRVTMRERIFVLTPSIEIHNQWLKEYAAQGIPAGTINDKGVTGRGMSVYVCMPMSLNNLLSLLPERFAPSGVITDECFIGKTKIISKRGNLKIKNVKIGDMVLSYNMTDYETYPEFKKVLNVLKIKNKKRIAKISLSNKTSIKCTEDHKIYSSRGWIAAGNIKAKSDKILIAQECNDELLYLRYGNTITEKKPKGYIQKMRKGLLFHGMFKNLLSRNKFEEHGGNKQKIRKREDEKKQPDAQFKNTRKDDCEAKRNRTQAQNHWWKRQRVDESTKNIIGCFKMGHGARSANQSKEKFWIPLSLQNRHSKSEKENRDRGGWRFPLFFKNKRKRQKENYILEWAGVENIEIQESGNNRRFAGLFKTNKYVYDLTVEDNHNYFANGVLAHNCHHSEAASWANIHRFYPHAWRMGLTATPERYDGLPLSNTYTDIVSTITPRQAIDGGFLSDYLLIVPEQYALDVQVQNGEYDLEEQAAQLGKPRIIGDVISQYSGIFAGLPCLVACSTHEHARKMTEEFTAAGWNFEHIHSGLPYHERARMLKGIRKGTINGLCTVGIGIEGLDIPGLYGLIWLRRTMSVTIYLQFIGRVLRRAPGKKYGIILDPVGNVFIHGRPDMERAWTLEGRAARIEKEEGVPKMKICPTCKVMNAEGNVLCHICGHDFTQEREKGPGRAFPAMVDGKLVILDAERLEARKEAIREALEGQRAARGVGGDCGAGGVDGVGHGAGHDATSRGQKIALLKNGLKSKGGLFSGAVKGWL